MKDILIFTFSSKEKNLPKRLFEAGINLNLVSIISNKENLKGILRQNRPKIVLIDGELPSSLFLNCLDTIEESISDFDIDSRICIFEADRKTPGTVFLENFKELKIFYNAIPKNKRPSS